MNAAGYYGKYQFDEGTWASVGGSGNPAEASEAEQDYRAALLYSRAGSSPWPRLRLLSGPGAPLAASSGERLAHLGGPKLASPFSLRPCQRRS